MISPDFIRTMTTYNRWQNNSLYRAAGQLSDQARRQDRGSFFGSIHKTLAHIVWADQVWLSRFGACQAPSGGIASSTTELDDWTALQSAREDMDQTFGDWASGLTADATTGQLEWYSGAAGKTMSLPKWLLIQHMFNHQTHHRGQVHAMLTAAGAAPDDTDLFLMPDQVI